MLYCDFLEITVEIILMDGRDSATVYRHSADSFKPFSNLARACSQWKAAIEPLKLMRKHEHGAADHQACELLCFSECTHCMLFCSRDSLCINTSS